MVWMITGSIFSALCGFVLFLYFLRKGQFDHLEETKYQLFHDDEEEPHA